MLNLHLIAIFKKPAKSPFYLYSFNKLVYSKLQIRRLFQPDFHQHSRQNSKFWETCFQLLPSFGFYHCIFKKY